MSTTLALPGCPLPQPRACVAEKRGKMRRRGAAGPHCQEAGGPLGPGSDPSDAPRAPGEWGPARGGRETDPVSTDRITDIRSQESVIVRCSRLHGTEENLRPPSSGQRSRER